MLNVPLRVAWFSPLPPTKTGVADYCAELLPPLSAHLKIELFVEDPALHEGQPIADMFPMFPYWRFEERQRVERFDLCIYQMGNSIAHRFVYLALIDTPGLVVLHEPMLHHFMLEMLSEGWTELDYSRELDYNYGAGRGDIEEAVAADGTELSRFGYPMIQRVVDCSLGIIVHSKHARDVVLSHRSRCPVAVVPHSYVPEPHSASLDVAGARRELGLDDEALLVGSFGFITPAKRIEQVLEAFEEFAAEAPEARLILAGGHVPQYPVEELIEARGLTGRVIMPGYVPWEKLMCYMVACDLALAYRWPSAGETPGGLVRLMGLGKPALVSDHMALAEFPDDCCIKVKPGREVEGTLSALRELKKDRGAYLEMGRRARQYIERNNRVEDVAEAYATFARSLLLVQRGAPESKGGAREELLDEVADALTGMGVGPDSRSLLAHISAAIDDMFD
jgi:glycosyltransferase involved in cell wall biosynthesis